MLRIIDHVRGISNPLVALNVLNVSYRVRHCQESEAPETIDGIRVKRSGKRAKGGASVPARPRVEKTVVNCLACGKVYDCRPVTNDIIMFLGGHASTYRCIRRGLHADTR